jgi:DNA-directed RNA polymerase sigma subunit (sigma70/sigma32)
MHLPVVQESCALEAAELGGMTFKEIAARLSLTCERVRQIESGALTKLWLHLGENKGRRAARTVAMRRRLRIAA